MKIIQQLTGMYVKQLNEFILTTNRSDAKDFTKEEIKEALTIARNQKGEDYIIDKREMK
jgi:hypothetical protein